MDKNSLDYLKSKIWYRLLKVVYGVVVLYVMVVVAVMVFDLTVSELKRIDYEKTIIICGDNMRYSFLQHGRTIVDYSELYMINARDFCLSRRDIDEQELRESKLVDIVISPLMSLKSSIFVASFVAFFSTCLCFLFFFQFVRRLFYYIVLGKFFPERR